MGKYFDKLCLIASILIFIDHAAVLALEPMAAEKAVVRIRTGFGSCSGSVLGKRTILTARHCVDEVRAAYFIRGSDSQLSFGRVVYLFTWTIVMILPLFRPIRTLVSSLSQLLGIGIILRLAIRSVLRDFHGLHGAERSLLQVRFKEKISVS